MKMEPRRVRSESGGRKPRRPPLPFAPVESNGFLVPRGVDDRCSRMVTILVPMMSAGSKL